MDQKKTTGRSRIVDTLKDCGNDEKYISLTDLTALLVGYMRLYDEFDVVFVTSDSTAEKFKKIASGLLMSRETVISNEHRLVLSNNSTLIFHSSRGQIPNVPDLIVLDDFCWEKEIFVTNQIIKASIITGNEPVLRWIEKKEMSESEQIKKQPKLRARISKKGWNMMAEHVSNMDAGPNGVKKAGICSICKTPLIYEEKPDCWLFYCTRC